jgi:hypothetical protein
MIEQNEMVATLVDVSERLHSLGIDYMVTGSFAMASYVTARTTMDIDIVLDITASDATRFEHKFAGDYYVTASSIARAFERQSMFNIVNNSTLVKVDCIIKKTDSFEIGRFERRRRGTIGTTEFWVISKEDLILSKLRWASGSYSERQFEDIRKLLASGADEGFLSDMVANMHLNDVWKAFEKWKIRVAK